MAYMANKRPTSMLHFVFECVFLSICGWIGHIVVRTLTLGRVKLDWGADSESNVTEVIGGIFLLMIGILTVSFFL
jgi:hypothetical protein